MSSTDETTLEALMPQLEEGKFRILDTTFLGYHGNEMTQTLGLSTRYLLKLEAPEPEKVPPFKLDPNRSALSQAREQDEYWKKQQRLRMELNSDPHHLRRYTKGVDFEHIVPKRISQNIIGGWKGICEWVHEQTSGRWNVKVFADYDQRPGHSFMLFCFEEPESATIFKLFQI